MLKRVSWAKSISVSVGEVVLLCACAASISCSTEFFSSQQDENVNDYGGVDGAEEDGAGLAEGEFQVRFRNLTIADPVDVGFHVAVSPLENPPDGLFVPENFYGTGIGLGGNGRLAPGDEAVIELSCSEGLTLGTQGGTFMDTETGEVNGTGPQLWLQEGAQFSCGAVIIFEYLMDGDEYDTLLHLLGG